MNFKLFFLCFVSAAILALNPLNRAFADDADKKNDEQAESPQESAPQIATNVTGSYLSSHFARDTGNIDLAIRDLQRVHREEPDNRNVALQLQGMLLVQGHIEEAMTLANSINESDHKDPLSSLLLALRALKANDPDTAAKILEQTADSSNPQLWLPLMLGWLDIDRHTLEKPLTIEAVSSDVGRAAPLVNYHLALINSQGGFKDEAAKNFKSAIVDAKDPPARVMKQLLRFYDQNDGPEQLTALVKEYRDANPDSDKYGDIPAITTVEDGVSEILYTMGGIMFGAGVANDAAIYLQLALYVKPDLTEAMVALGDTYGELQQYARANDMYARILPENTFYAKAQLHIAVNDERMGKLKDALHLLDTMSKQPSQAAEALVTKGDLLRIHERYGEAVDAYSAALKVIPELKSMYWPLLFARGSCYEREGKWPEAEKDFLTALDLKPDQPDVLNYLGFGWLERGMHIEEARNMIAKAVKQRPDDAQIVDSMGWALYMEGDYTASAPYLEKAVELLPGDATVNDHLGDVYWRLGRKNEARFQWQRSLSFSPETKVAENLHRKLKDGLPPTHLANRVAPADDSVDQSKSSATP